MDICYGIFIGVAVLITLTESRSASPSDAQRLPILQQRNVKAQRQQGGKPAFWRAIIDEDVQSKFLPPKQNPKLAEALKILQGSKSVSSPIPVALASIPSPINFSCDLVHQAGFYADEDFNCQVIRRCNPEGGLISYLCGDQLLFNQITLVCDWYYNVDCTRSSQFSDYSNARLYHKHWPLFDHHVKHT
ncbi:hypothetical protein BV898_03518 [Hypsibius exemplaris]|uniref:Chitin-binding type-2 domain-containing protein n=1 Tax=Hypsibius exemplaris TaxID=2072580 RepID=A0A1W0X587_HYPEX|nr:hypothetical protein BV898_03518 [Hypsibius exemplaris]